MSEWKLLKNLQTALEVEKKINDSKHNAQIESTQVLAEWLRNQHNSALRLLSGFLVETRLAEHCAKAEELRSSNRQWSEIAAGLIEDADLLETAKRQLDKVQSKGRGAPAEDEQDQVKLTEMVAKMNRTFAEKEIKKIIRYKFGAKNALYNQLSSLQTQINLTRAQIELLDLIPEAYDMESLKLHTDSLGTRARKILSDSLDQNCSNSSSSFNDVSSSENDSEIKNIKDDSPKNFKSPQKVVLKCSCCGDLCQTASPSLLDVNDSLMDCNSFNCCIISKSYHFLQI